MPYKEAPLISVVSPVYMAAGCLHELHRRINDSLSKITDNYEIIFVEDGGNDGSWEIICELSKTNPRFRGLKLSRNFGVHNAITAGVENAEGSWVIVIECDLEDNPEEINALYKEALKGYDIVISRYRQRSNKFSRWIVSKAYWKIISYLSGMRLDHRLGIYRILSRKVVNDYCRFKERNRHFKGIIEWMGYKTSYVDMERGERFSGRSAFTVAKLFKAAVMYMLVYSNRPLKLFIGLGFIFAVSALVGAFIIILYTLFQGIDVPGWASLMVSLYLIGGIIIINLGIIGYYLGQNLDETRQRPVYLVSDNTDTRDEQLISKL
jgi:dolichol-phosphate mannosyltransferase